MSLGARASCPHRAEGPQGADRSDTPEPATPPSRPHARAGHTPARGAQCRRGRPWVPCRGRALEKPESVGVARLAMWRASGPLAGGTPALPGGGPVSDVPGSAGILPATGRRPAKCRQERHARAGYSPEPATPPPEAPNAVEVGLGSDVPGSAGILPATGRRPAKCRQERHARAGYSPARGAQCRRGRSWVHCRGRALEKPESVGVARLAMWRAFGPLAGGTPALPGGGSGSDVPGSAGILPASGRRPVKRREERHARAGYSPEPATPPPEAPNAVEVGLTPARGAQCRRGRPWVPCRGRALEEPESVGVAPLPMRRACGPLAGGTPALPGGPWERCPGSAGILPAPGRRPARRRQERHARAGYSPEPATPPPEAHNAIEAGLGCTAEDGHWRSPRAWASPAWRCGGPVARLRAGRPRSQGVAL